MENKIEKCLHCGVGNTQIKTVEKIIYAQFAMSQKAYNEYKIPEE